MDFKFTFSLIRISVPLLLLAFAYPSPVAASDADPLQDFCVALPNQPISINGLVCKNANQVNASDFKSALLRLPGVINKALGSAVTLADAQTFPGLNTQGLSVARSDFAPHGVVPPHVHPRASEVVFVVQGTLLVGFVDTINNTLFEQTIYAGDLFVFPRGLVHFLLNLDAHQPAVSISALNSQNPGVSLLAVALLAANPPLPERVLETSFGIDEKEVSSLMASVGKTV